MINAIIILLGFLLAIFLVLAFYVGVFLIIYLLVGFFIQGTLQVVVSLMLTFMIFIIGRL